MRKYLLMTCALAAPAVLTAAGPQGGAGQPFRISAGVDLVVLDVAVVDRRGRCIQGLQEQDFTVLENGRPQSISLFRNEDIPVAAGVIVDASGSMRAKRSAAIAAALAFLMAGNPDDEIFVVNFNDTAALGLPPAIPFTSDAALLRSALDSMPARGRTALYDAIATALDHIRRSRHNRRFLVVFSDGEDNESGQTLRSVSDALAESGVTLYAVGLLDPSYRGDNPGVLRKLARLTGGRAYFPEDLARLTSVCLGIAADIRARYIIGYSPGETAAEGEFRRVEVKVQAPGRGVLEVRTRTGYRVPGRR
jgi:VWFA-related protein